MDELRERLERVLNDPPPQYHPIQSSLPIKGAIRGPTLISPSKLTSTNSQCLNSRENFNKQLKAPLTMGSTPLPRKQIQSFGNLSYRTINTSTRHHEQQQMSKSFMIPTKREGILFIEIFHQ
jgi:hypothetical protein